jgi:hypothetical protein
MIAKCPERDCEQIDNDPVITKRDTMGGGWVKTIRGNCPRHGEFSLQEADPGPIVRKLQERKKDPKPSN